MKNITPITDAVVLDEYNAPKDPWTFARQIEANQELDLRQATLNILYNKGRYFECTMPSIAMRDEVCELIGIKPEYGMIAASWRKMEEFVLAMNCFGWRVSINVDWI